MVSGTRRAPTTARSAPHGHDHEGEDGDEQRDDDRPEEVAPARAAVRRQRKRAQRPGARAQARPRAQPDEDEGADAGCKEAGEEDERQGRPAEAGRLDDDDAADHGRAEDRRDRREAARRPHQAERLVGRVALDGPHRQDPEPRAEGYQRRLRPEDEAEAERRDGGEENARQLDRLCRLPARLEPVGGHVTALAGEALDRERRQEPGEREPRERPPPRHRVEAEIVRQVLVDPIWSTWTSSRKPTRRRRRRGRSAPLSRGARDRVGCGSALRDRSGGPGRSRSQP